MLKAFLAFVALDALAAVTWLAVAGPVMVPDRLAHNSESVWQLEADGTASLLSHADKPFYE